MNAATPSSLRDVFERTLQNRAVRKQKGLASKKLGRLGGRGQLHRFAEVKQQHKAKRKNERKQRSAADKTEG